MSSEKDIATAAWLILADAIDALVAAKVLPPYDYDADDGRNYYMAPGSESALTALFCREAFAGRLRLKGYPTGYGEEMPAGPLQDIPPAYFHRERFFYGFRGISQMPGNASQADWRRYGALKDSGHPETDWIDIIVSGTDFAVLLSSQAPARQQAPEKLAKRSGPDLERVIDTLRVARAWKIERAAKQTLPPTPHARALACLHDRGDSLKHGYEALRKIFEGKYAAALRAVDEGRAVPIWDS